MKRTVICICLIISMLASLCIPFSSVAVEDEGINADVNSDGYIDMKDLLAVRRMVKRLDVPTAAGDVDGDGKVSALDVFYLRSILKEHNESTGELSATVYTVPADLYQEFIRNISLDTLNNDPRVEGIEKLTYTSADSSEAVYEDVLEGKTNNVDDGNYVRIGKHYLFCIEKSEMEFLNTPAKLKQLLLDNGFETKIAPKLVCIFDTANSMPVVWIKCGDENYFVEPYWDDKFILQAVVYSEEDYVSRVKLEKAVLTVNGTVVEDEYSYTCENYSTVSAVKVLESLGAEIVWTNNVSATISINSKVYYLDLTNAKISSDKNGISLFLSFGGSDIVIEPVSGDLIIDEWCLITMLASIYNVKYIEAKAWVNIDTAADTITVNVS